MRLVETQISSETSLALGLRSLRTDEKQKAIVTPSLYYLRGGENRETCPASELSDCIGVYVLKKYQVTNCGNLGTLAWCGNQAATA